MSLERGLLQKFYIGGHIKHNLQWRARCRSASILKVQELWQVTASFCARNKVSIQNSCCTSTRYPISDQLRKKLKYQLLKKPTTSYLLVAPHPNVLVAETKREECPPCDQKCITFQSFRLFSTPQQHHI